MPPAVIERIRIVRTGRGKRDRPHNLPVQPELQPRRIARQIRLIQAVPADHMVIPRQERNRLLRRLPHQARLKPMVQIAIEVLRPLMPLRVRRDRQRLHGPDPLPRPGCVRFRAQTKAGLPADGLRHQGTAHHMIRMHIVRSRIIRQGRQIRQPHKLLILLIILPVRLLHPSILHHAILRHNTKIPVLMLMHKLITDRDGFRTPVDDRRLQDPLRIKRSRKRLLNCRIFRWVCTVKYNLSRHTVPSGSHLTISRLRRDKIFIRFIVKD